jgi:hypothetical protein
MDWLNIALVAAIALVAIGLILAVVKSVISYIVGGSDIVASLGRVESLLDRNNGLQKEILEKLNDMNFKIDSLEDINTKLTDIHDGNIILQDILNQLNHLDDIADKLGNLEDSSRTFDEFNSPIKPQDIPDERDDLDDLLDELENKK